MASVSFRAALASDAGRAALASAADRADTGRYTAQ